MNKMTMFSEQLDSTFVTLDIVAWILGLFSLIVGMFGIANIMFVSVKERTPVIGVQKALGAKNSFILIQFLYESVVLSIIGGLIGIVLVWIISMAIAKGADFPIYFSMNNFLTGISLSMITGVLAGIIPALRASRLNPVDAIRS
jgi:putative ABC transport system permease protein